LLTTQIDVLAPAKINLTLHVTGRRLDGHHLLDSLVAFTIVGDQVSVSGGSGKPRLTVGGPFAAGVPTGPENSVMQAAEFYGARDVSLHLTKNLPPASGIGGGSSDAAATLRALSEFFDKTYPKDIIQLGADVPVCMGRYTARMTGIGETLSPVPPLPETGVVLVNPGVEVSTPAVFNALASKSNAPMPDRIPSFDTSAALAAWLDDTRNDLEVPAQEICPVIGDVTAALSATRGCLLARMSGSGATCFGLYASQSEADRAQDALSAAHPGWWVQSTKFLSEVAPPRTHSGLVTSP